MKLRFVRVFALMALMATLGCSPGTEEASVSTPSSPEAGTPGAGARPSRAVGGGGKAKTKPKSSQPKAPPKPKAPAVGMMAPDISGPDTDGVEFNLSDYRGKVVMIDFWGDW